MLLDIYDLQNMNKIDFHKQLIWWYKWKKNNKIFILNSGGIFTLFSIQNLFVPEVSMENAISAIYFQGNLTFKNNTHFTFFVFCK